MAGIESQMHCYSIDADELRGLPLVADVLVAGLFEDLIQGAFILGGFEETAYGFLDVSPRLFLRFAAA